MGNLTIFPGGQRWPIAPTSKSEPTPGGLSAICHKSLIICIDDNFLLEKIEDKMFNKITLRNYRTHRATTLELQPITLLIGNNDSGKTNFLSGIQHFSGLIRRGNPDRQQDRTVRAKDYFPHRYRLANDDDSMSIEIEWIQNSYFIKYYMELYKNDKFAGYVACREKLELRSDRSSDIKTFENGYQAETNLLELQGQISRAENIKQLYQDFFRDLAYTFSYHLQPSFLKGIVDNNQTIDDLINSDEEIEMPSYLGYEGRNLQKLIYYVKNKEERVFSRFLTLMRRFANNRNFQGVRYDRDKYQLLWEFELGRNTSDRLVDELPLEAISNGLIKAAAIALLISMQPSPALILMEEIENAIDTGNLQELFYWLWQATAPNQQEITPQLILTSHSPSVLREFYQNLDYVYIFSLKKYGHQSVVRKLNQDLDVLMKIGAVEGEIIEDKKNGKRLVEVPKYRLTDLWYSGAIG